MHESSLAHIANAFLSVSLNKNPSIRYSNWGASTLTNTQIDSAANDVQVAVELFKFFAKKIKPNKPPENIIEHYFVDPIGEDFGHQGGKEEEEE